MPLIPPWGPAIDLELGTLPQLVTDGRYSIWTVLPRYDSGGRGVGGGRARIFAAAEAHYMDRRLAGNVVLSFFDGPKAGSDEVATSHPMPLTTLLAILPIGPLEEIMVVLDLLCCNQNVQL